SPCHPCLASGNIIGMSTGFSSILKRVWPAFQTDVPYISISLDRCPARSYHMCDRGRQDMDRFDQAILAELERDARQSFGAIAERVGLSKTPCWNRVRALERQGVIEGYRAVVNSEALGLFLNAFVQVSVEFGAYRSFEKAVLEHPAILDCYTTAGSADYIMHVVAEDA